VSAPNLTIAAEPFESGAVVYAPLAPRTSADSPTGQLSLVLTITNHEASTVHANTVTLSFASPPNVSAASIPVGLSIGSGQSAAWNFATQDNIILPVPAPASVTIGVLCDGFSSPATLTATLAPHESPVPGGYLFPAKLDELEGGEFWRGRSAVHGPAGGNQLFAYDMWIEAFDGQAGQWTALKPGGSASVNSDTRIWENSIVAMADGTVQSWEDGIPTNPNPPADLSPPNPVEGNHFYIQHASDLVLYAHLEQGTLNQQLTQTPSGAQVEAGDILGLADNSGNSSGPHLHVHAIKGTQPWQGPPRPLLFRDINVIDRSAINPPDPSGPWSAVQEQGLPSVDALIWPSPTKPVRVHVPSIYEVAIDPLALILEPQVYIKLTLPDPPPIDVWTREVRERVRDMTPKERKAVLARLKELGERFNALERALEQ
jgi:Peptidase family M23